MKTLMVLTTATFFTALSASADAYSLKCSVQTTQGDTYSIKGTVSDPWNEPKWEASVVNDGEWGSHERVEFKREDSIQNPDWIRAGADRYASTKYKIFSFTTSAAGLSLLVVPASVKRGKSFRAVQLYPYLGFAPGEKDYLELSCKLN